MMPLGVWLGVWLNRRFSEGWFNRAVLIALFPSGVQLIGNFKFGGR